VKFFLRGCRKCGGDVYVQKLVDGEVDHACLQCGWRDTVQLSLLDRRNLEIIDASFTEEGEP